MSEADTPGQAPIVPIDQIRNANTGEWVLVKVTEIDESGWPVSGQVMARTNNRAEASKRLIDDYKSPSPEFRQGTTGYHLFSAYPLGRTVGDWRRALDRVAQMDDGEYRKQFRGAW